MRIQRIAALAVSTCLAFALTGCGKHEEATAKAAPEKKTEKKAEEKAAEKPEASRYARPSLSCASSRVSTLANRLVSSPIWVGERIQSS